MKAESLIATAVTLIFLVLTTSLLLNSIFGILDQDEATSDSRHRQKRQDPGIGDESNRHDLVIASSLPTYPNQTINPRYMPTLANGFIGVTVYDKALYLNGLYTGSGGDSHRAMIPSKIMSRIRVSNPEVDSRATKKFHFSAAEGYFMEYIDCDFAYVYHKIYVHQKYIRVLVSDIYWKRKSGSLGGGKLVLDYPEFSASPDIDFGEAQHYYAHYHSTGVTRSTEQGAPRTVHVFWMDALKEIAIQGNDDGNYTAIMSVDTQEANARSEFDEAIKLIESGNNGHYRLFAEHKNAWANTWAKGRVELEGDLQLSKITTFSQYYLYSNLPAIDPYLPPPHSHYYYGMARCSLAKGERGRDYQGHIMWDSEVYMLPAVLPFHPDLVKRMLRYRKETGPAAADIAERMGGKGYKYAWQSAYSGQEVSPDTCQECSDRKMHTSAGVSWGIRQFFSATRDRDYLVNADYAGCDITREIARFYADRAVYDPSIGRYDLREMTGPDENYPDVDNNAYTMAAASLAIHWARFMACQCQRNEREEVPDEWIQIALYYNLPFDNVKRLHNAFEGFEQIPAPQVGQADTTLLTYPLNWNMSRDIMRHDLEFYEQFTSDRTPALTWSFFTVGWKWVEEEAKLNAYFLKSYQDYLIQPFKVWTEYNERSLEDQMVGAVNFLPGMGGFLQSLIYGFAGLRIRPEFLEFHHPYPPPGTTRLRLRGFQYLQANMTIEISQSQVTLEIISIGEFPLVLKRNDTSQVEESLTPGAFITLERPSEGFYIYSSIGTGCEHPRDHIFMPWGYSPWIDASPSLRATLVTSLLPALTLLLFCQQTAFS